MATFVLESLGCKLNQAEIEALGHELVRRGHELAKETECADVYVLNTCTVTHVADRKSRHALRMARRMNPRATTVALGCYAKRAPEDLLRLGIVDHVVAFRETDKIADMLESGDRISRTAGSCRIVSPLARTRSFIKVQEGCTSFCSFCIVPHVRMPSSRSIEAVLGEARARVDSGVKEIVLTGTRIGDYRRNGSESAGFASLVKSVLTHTEVSRVRLSSLGPHDLSSEMLELWADRRLCPHLHLPLQSGSEAVLKRMNRPYSLDEYAGSVERARQAIPDLAVTTDILVGFPGETEEDFQRSFSFCTRMGFAGIHVFSFSARAGTAAALLPNQIDEKTKKERSVRMLKLSNQSARNYRKSFVGRTMEVLWEKKAKGTAWNGLTGNYLRVFAEGDDDLTGCLMPVELMAEHPQGLIGRLMCGGGNG
jgi:threonylcarbamoyladenosine tRNA methylthiotransferase MtaB